MAKAKFHNNYVRQNLFKKHLEVFLLTKLQISMTSLMENNQVISDNKTIVATFDTYVDDMTKHQIFNGVIEPI